MLLLALASVQVAAETSLPVTDPAYAKFIGTVTGNTVSVGFATDGKPLASTSSPALASVGQSSTAGALVRDAQVNTKYGPATFRVSQGFTIGKLASGVAAVATNPLVAVSLAIAAPFIADWLSDAGVTVTADGPTITDPSLLFGHTTSGPWGSRMFAANNWLTMRQALGSVHPSKYIESCHPDSTRAECYACMPDNSACEYVYLYTQQGTSEPRPVTALDISSRLEANARTLSEIENIIAESAKLDALPTTGNPTPTITPPDGQPSIKSPTKTETSTKTNPDGTKVEEVKSCWITGTVNTGASMTMREVCNTDTTTKAADGTVTGTSTTSTTSEGDPTQIQDEGGFCDSLVGKLLCADLDTPEEPVPERSVSVSYNPLNLFGAGSCPAPRAYTSVQTGQTHTASFQPICDALALLRPMFLAIAAFIAYMILLPKGAD